MILYTSTEPPAASMHLLNGCEFLRTIVEIFKEFFLKNLKFVFLHMMIWFWHRLSAFL
jgi:hypothetical protein